MANLQKMSDSDLATYQAGWKEGTPEWYLAQREYDRRSNEPFLKAAQLSAEAAEEAAGASEESARWAFWTAIVALVTVMVSVMPGFLSWLLD